MNSCYQIQSTRLPQLETVEVPFISGQLMATPPYIAFKMYNFYSSCIHGSFVYYVQWDPYHCHVKQLQIVLQTAGLKNPSMQKFFFFLNLLRSSFQSPAAPVGFATISDLIHRERNLHQGNLLGCARFSNK